MADLCLYESIIIIFAITEKRAQEALDLLHDA